MRVLHLHDRDWVFIPAGDKKFKRVEVHAGEMLPGNKQELLAWYCTRVSRLSPTCSSLKPRWRRND
jgi:hypothetical protein